MDEAIVSRLLAINQEFYGRFAEPFVETRARPQQGFFKLLEHLPQSAGRMLDAGCGDGRFGRFCLANGLAGEYTGLDFSPEMLQTAAKRMANGRFIQRDLSRPGGLDGLGSFHLVGCLAAMQHIPGRENRLRLLREMAACLAPDGRIVLSNWQFLDSERQRRKIVPWPQAGLRQEDVEPDDYLLAWQRDGQGCRYVAAIDESETAAMAQSAALEILAQFRSDGREGNLNLYTILGRNQ